MEKFLITGGQGFIGAWMARQLLDEGTAFVLFDRQPDDHILAQVIEPHEIGELERVFGDVADPRQVEEAVASAGATHLVHLAGLQVPTCREDPVLGARVNVIGTLNVFEAARRHADRLRGVVYASSAAVAGPTEDYAGPIDDDTHHVPRTHYGVFKTANEGSARVYWLDHGVPSVGLRPLAVYGVGREIGISSGPTKAIRAVVLGEEYTIPFSGTTGFNYAGDVAAVFVASARALREGAHALNHPGEIHTVEEFLRCVEEVVPGARGKLRSEGDPLPVAHDFDEPGLRRLLGEVPHTPIREGIRATAERFRVLRERGQIP
ncbi:MAG: NAD(P)-dependent oxidoreductase [Planctomycetota bacterium]|nr:NAD(P)-dependent oxidoreductase [Planctomycetota bacterium]